MNSPTVCLHPHLRATFWFTGLPGAGKSTLAQALAGALRERAIPACVLDGDDLRAGLCRDLGFSTADREENMRRVAHLARLLNDQGICAVVALVSPTLAGRATARRIVTPQGFFEIHVSTPLAICRQRDPKGLYARAEQDPGLALTGVGAPYELPKHPELRIDTDQTPVIEAVQQILSYSLPERPCP